MEEKEVFTVWDGWTVDHWGPYTRKSTAETVLKMVQMIMEDDGAEIAETPVNQFADEVDAGLKPYKVMVSMANGRVKRTQARLVWPPQEEGIISETEGEIVFFVWARSMDEAPRGLVRIRKQQALKACS
jgi:hypothetical protein